MIEKIPFETEVLPYKDKTIEVQTHASPYDLQIKINELVDAVNEFEKDREEIKAWIAIVSDLRSRVPVVENRVSILEEHAHPTAKTPDLPDGDDAIQEVIHADPYAEQRNYLCKLCWFWNENYEDGVIGVLTGIFDNAYRPFERNIDQTLYEHCEPVKPDDDIIYKKEQQ